MKVKLKPGKYILAVSGGVDSMVLLDMVANLKGVEVVVAHFDHGIHGESAVYRDFVGEEAKRRGVEFSYEEGKLGAGTSEDTARKARYAFLKKVKNRYGADAIITAHHRDDVLETAIINLLRGSGPKGLASLGSSAEIIRPLLPYSKKQITDYARKNKLEWREDPTNLDTSYLRNYVRLKIIPRLTAQDNDRLMGLIENQRKTGQAVNNLIATLSQQSNALQLDRKFFVSLPHSAAREILAHLLRAHGLPIDRKLLEKAVVFAKTAKQKKKMSITKQSYLEIDDNLIELNLL